MSEKSERISSAIGMLNDEMIIEADKNRNFTEKSKEEKSGIIIRRVLIPAAACAAVTAAVFALNRTAPDIPDISNVSETSAVSFSEDAEYVPALYAEALAEAVYPEAAICPDWDDYILPTGEWDDGEYFPDYDVEGYNEANKKWREYDKTRTDKFNDLDREALNGFYKLSANEFLTENSGKNAVFSPVNVYIALSMLAEITDGSSRGQLLDLLRAENIETVRGQSGALWELLYRNDGSAHSLLANSLWLSENVDFDKNTVKRLSEDYYASSYRGDVCSEEMTDALRKWLNDQTGGLLEGYIQDIKLTPDTIIALCSTVYFRGKWENEFDPDNNDIKIFHSPDGDKETEFMNIYLCGENYYYSKDYSAISRPFTDRSTMWFILPDEDKTVEDVLRSGDYMDMITMCGNLGESVDKKYIRVNFSVPKFDISSDTDLSDGLKALGVTDIFDFERADFTPLTDDADICTGKIEHAARVQIDEEGCTAASYVFEPAAGASEPDDEEIDLIFDRPFIFVIASDRYQPMFAGIVNDPVK